MGEITAVPLLALLLALWAYLKFSPYHERPRDIRVFNAMVLGLGAFLWLGWYITITHHLTRAGLLKYKYLFGIGGGAAAGLVYVGVFFCLRNFWIFGDKSNRPGRF